MGQATASLFSLEYDRLLGPTIRDRVTQPAGIAYLGDGVGVGAVGDLGRTRAVRLVSSDNLGGVGHIRGSRVGSVASVGASGEGNSSNGELHFD